MEWFKKTNKKNNGIVARPRRKPTVWYDEVANVLLGYANLKQMYILRGELLVKNR